MQLGGRLCRCLVGIPRYQAISHLPGGGGALIQIKERHASESESYWCGPKNLGDVARASRDKDGKYEVEWWYLFRRRARRTRLQTEGFGGVVTSSSLTEICVSKDMQAWQSRAAWRVWVTTNGIGMEGATGDQCR